MTATHNLNKQAIKFVHQDELLFHLRARGRVRGWLQGKQ